MRVMKEVIRGGGGGVGGVAEERLPSLALGSEVDLHGASTREKLRFSCPAENFQSIKKTSV